MNSILRPAILVLPPPSLYRKLFSTGADAHLRELARSVVFNVEERDWTSEKLAARIGEFDVVITGWRSPKFTADVIARSHERPLRLVAHSAGSVKFLFPDEQSIGNGFAVTTAAAAMGPAVAEMALLMTLLLLRPIHRLDAQMKSGGDWRGLKAMGSSTQHEVFARRVGVIGAGYTGRHYIRMLGPLGAEIVVYDPYLSDDSLAELDVERVESLDELLSTCSVVALHAPTTPETHHMIGQHELSLLCDGAIIINTARAALVDSDALLAELRSGRIMAGLDVFDAEPLPADSPFRQLDNVLMTPHIASHTSECYVRQGDLVVDEIQRLCRGDSFRYQVTPGMLATMA